MNPDTHRACEQRYRELLERTRDLAERVDQLEAHQQMLVGLLREFRQLVRLVTTRLKALDRRLERTLARLVPLSEAGERISRHFRN